MAKDEHTGLTVFQPSEFMIFDETQNVAAMLQENTGGDEISVGDLERINIPTGGGQRWTVPSAEGEREAEALTGVIVHQQTSRAYWPGEFRGEGAEPDCTSPDGEWGFGNPGDKLRAAGRGCATCPMAQWGSDPNGGRGQACKLMKRLYILLPGEILPHVLVLPPSSIAIIKKYLLRLGANPYYGVVTRIGLERVKNATGINYSRIVPTLVTKLSTDQTASVSRYRDSLIPALKTSAQRGDPSGYTIPDADTDV